MTEKRRKENRANAAAREDKKTKTTERLEKIGHFVENRLNLRVTKKHRAPELVGRPVRGLWYRIPVEGGLTADGSEYHIYLKKAAGEKGLCVFLSGGGIAWDEHSAAGPSSMDRLVAREPNYYWSNLRPVTEPLNIGFGMMDVRYKKNIFADWSILLIPYATGDLHIGRGELTYRGEDGKTCVAHFHGYENFRSGMELGAPYFPKPKKLLIAGDSAGAIALPALAPEIIDDFFPNCPDVSLISDSGLLTFRRWRSTIRDVWKADERFWKPSKSGNLMLDWYRELHAKKGDSLRYLYAGSTHDYMLAAYYNDMTNGLPRTDEEVQRRFCSQYRQMVMKLRETIPDMTFFIHDIRNMFSHGGTVHTALRRPEFFHRNASGDTMARWLRDALDGNAYNVGTELLNL